MDDHISVNVKYEGNGLPIRRDADGKVTVPDPRPARPIVPIKVDYGTTPESSPCCG